MPVPTETSYSAQLDLNRTKLVEEVLSVFLIIPFIFLGLLVKDKLIQWCRHKSPYEHDEPVTISRRVTMAHGFSNSSFGLLN